ncbi:uncharacterized protein LY79DRAFT_10357 [Colletotrichum navitas]|uniref:Uncharacterized protein n=1 Tax=Colletotrichum navitas TaxID=681940 RepID=A0AAD8QFI5_9PEZI|nr:uncharacterized protein LY79DRAFT_10357 [Colletotrichum navitas]KAK1600194.1 hypothetical protein LY79DRAFT_10357 [Colletotrichum navitas]
MRAQELISPLGRDESGLGPSPRAIIQSRSATSEKQVRVAQCAGGALRSLLPFLLPLLFFFFFCPAKTVGIGGRTSIVRPVSDLAAAAAAAASTAFPFHWTSKTKRREAIPGERKGWFPALDDNKMARRGADTKPDGVPLRGCQSMPSVPSEEQSGVPHHDDVDAELRGKPGKSQVAHPI